MATPKTVEFFQGCSSSSTECFATDPDAFDAITGGGDSGVSEDYYRVAQASAAAGIAGTALNEATYEPVEIVVAGQMTDCLGNTSDYHAFGYGEPRKILGDSEQDSEDEFGCGENASEVEGADIVNEYRELKQRIARCAHACGSAAVGCPLKPNPEN